jgi:hypothetical protein
MHLFRNHNCIISSVKVLAQPMQPQSMHEAPPPVQASRLLRRPQRAIDTQDILWPPTWGSLDRYMVLHAVLKHNVTLKRKTQQAGQSSE